MFVPQKQNRVWLIPLVCALTSVIILVSFYRGWNTRHRPPMIAGSWYFDDLRTGKVENSIVTFSSLGEFDGDSAFGCRWSYRDGKIFFRTWRLNEESNIARTLTDTTLYSWFAETDEFPLIAEFNSDGSAMTLIAEDTGPRCMLRRVKQ